MVLSFLITYYYYIVFKLKTIQITNCIKLNGFYDKQKSNMTQNLLVLYILRKKVKLRCLNKLNFFIISLNVLSLGIRKIILIMKSLMPVEGNSTHQ